MNGHDSALAPLVRGQIETLTPLREVCSAAEMIDALAAGAALGSVLPEHPLLAECGAPQRVRIHVAYGGRINIEVTAPTSADRAGVAHVADIEPAAALHLLVRGAIPVLLGVDERGALRLAVLAAESDAPGLVSSGASAPTSAPSTAQACPDTTAYPSDPRHGLPPGLHSISLRDWAHCLNDDDTQCALIMTALAQWHAQAGYCTRCGQALFAVHCGWVRQCVNCAALEYPRQDPAVIMTVTDDADRMLLAHNTLWAPRRVSVLAGFVDAGESPECAVVREVWEEVRLRVDRVEPTGTQPWPFPRSLMLAYQARVAPGAGTELDPQPTEIEWAQWYSREEMTAAARSGEIILPGRNTIAYGLLSRWYGAALPVLSA